MKVLYTLFKFILIPAFIVIAAFAAFIHFTISKPTIRQATYPVGCSSTYQVHYGSRSTQPQKDTLQMDRPSDYWFPPGQSLLRYTYIKDAVTLPSGTLGSVETISHQGITETDTSVWLHPYRADYCWQCNAAPYPYVLLNKKPGDQWTFRNNIPGTEYKELGINGKVLTAYYTYRKDSILSFQGDERVPIMIIDAYLQSPRYFTKALFHFSTKYGFHKIDYQLNDTIYINHTLARYSVQ